jgi:hypothetical protein
MGRSRGWGAERTGREPMPSPGRSGVNQREVKQAFGMCIAEGDIEYWRSRQQPGVRSSPRYRRINSTQKSVRIIAVPSTTTPMVGFTGHVRYGYYPCPYKS